MMVTFADGNKPPVVAAVKEAQIPFYKFFKFNNSSLFTKDDTNEGSEDEDDDDDDESESFCEVFWKMGYKSLRNFFSTLGTVEPKSLQLTREVLQERQRLETIIQGLHQKISTGMSKIDELRQEEKILKQREADILMNQNFTYEVKVSKPTKIDLSGTGQYVTNCLECSFTCHYPCPYPDDEDKYRCTAMDNHGNPNQARCKVCPGRCSWRRHVNRPYRYEICEEIEKRTSEDLKRRYYTAMSSESSAKDMVANMEDHLKFLERKVLEMAREAKESMQHLDEIALKPTPLTEVEYIDLLIESEKQEAKPGFQQRIKYYENIKQQALIMTKLKDEMVEGVQGSSGERWESFKFW